MMVRGPSSLLSPTSPSAVFPCPSPWSNMFSLVISILLLSHQVVVGQFIYSFEVPDDNRFPGQSSMFDVSKFKIVMPSQLPRITPQSFAPQPPEDQSLSQSLPSSSSLSSSRLAAAAERRQSFSPAASAADGGLDSSAQNHVFLRQALPSPAETQPRTQPQLFSLPTDPRQTAGQPQLQNSLFNQNFQGSNFQHQQQLSLLPRTPSPGSVAPAAASPDPSSLSSSQRFISQPEQTFSPGPPPFSDPSSVPVFASNRVSSLSAGQQNPQLGSQAQGSAFQSQFLQPQAAPQPQPQQQQPQQGLTPSQIAALNFFNGATTAQDFDHLRQRQAQAAQAAQVRAQQEAQLRAQQEAAARAQQEAAIRAQQEAQARAQQEAAARAQQEAAIRAQQEAQARAQQEAAIRAQQEAQAKAQQEAAQRAAAEARLRQQQEAQARANADAALKQQREAQAAREAAIRAQQQADAAVARYRQLQAQLQQLQPPTQVIPQQQQQPQLQAQPQPQSLPQDPFSGQLDFQRTSGDQRQVQRQRQPQPIQSTSSSPLPRQQDPGQWNSQPQSQVQAQAQSQPVSQATSRPANLQIGQLPADTDSDGIPGEAGKDYPTLISIPQTSFSCSRVPLTGYYADTETACQVVHFCQKGGAQDSFLCPNGTIFNQEKFSCQWWYEVNCADAPKFYVLNDNLYKVPPATTTPGPNAAAATLALGDGSGSSSSRNRFASSSSSSAAAASSSSSSSKKK